MPYQIIPQKETEITEVISILSDHSPFPLFPPVKLFNSTFSEFRYLYPLCRFVLVGVIRSQLSFSTTHLLEVFDLFCFGLHSQPQSPHIGTVHCDEADDQE
jgi:hypothetical protein